MTNLKKRNIIKKTSRVRLEKLMENNIRNRVSYKRFDGFNKFLIDNNIDGYKRINILRKLHDTIDDLYCYNTSKKSDYAEESLNLLIDDINSE